MKSRFGVAAALLSALGAAAPVSAKTAAGALHEAHLKAVDADGNGAVSKSEYRTYMDAGFAKLDKNGDGVLGADELSGILAVEQFAVIDVDKNGRVTRAEYTEQVLKDFDAADRSKDGELK